MKQSNSSKKIKLSNPKINKVDDHIDRGFEFETAIEKITNFIVGDLGGSLVQLGDERVLILPPNASGVAGLEKEAHEGHS